LDLFEEFGAALAAGLISTDHADALAQVCQRLEPKVVAGLRAIEPHLLSYARTLGPEALVDELTSRVEEIRADGGRARYEQQLDESRAWLRLDKPTGLYHLHAVFDPIRGEAFQSILDQYIARLLQDAAYQSIPYEKLVLQALVDLVHHDIRLTPKGVVVVDERSARTGRPHADTVCENIDGARVPLDYALAACAIEGNVTAAILDRAGKPADLSTDARLASPAQRLELRAMNRECVFPGCDTPFSRLHAHHVTFHRDGGRTTVSDLVLICNGHHHDIHDRGWSLTIDEQRTVRIKRPDGTLHAVVPQTRLGGRPASPATPSENPEPSATSGAPPGTSPADAAPPATRGAPPGTSPADAAPPATGGAPPGNAPANAPPDARGSGRVAA
jgi:hypothetical protein